MFESSRGRMSQWLTGKEKAYGSLEIKKPPLDQLAKQAKEQWQQAQSYFENVKEPEVIDLAINNLEAAEKRYNYLLKQLREQ